jgi:hypothetical protein
LESHAEAKRKDRPYLQHVLAVFDKKFFEKMRSSREENDVWDHYFPKNWKVTRNNLGNPEAIVSSIILEHFLRWAQDRIVNSKGEPDLELDSVSSNLFPEAEPMTWSMILTYLLSPYYDPSSRIKSVLERPRIFGLSGRMMTWEFADSREIPPERENRFWEKWHGKLESETKNTLDLDNSEIERKRLFLLHIFSEMLNYQGQTHTE